MKNEKSEIEIKMEKMLKEAEDIVDDSYLTTQDARKILNIGYKLLYKCEELRKSRDTWSNKYKTSMAIQTSSNHGDKNNG